MLVQICFAIQRGSALSKVNHVYLTAAELIVRIESNVLVACQL